MDKMRNMAKSLSWAFDAMARFCLLGMTLLIVINVLCRITPIGPIDGTFELVGYLGAVLTAFALAQNQMQDGNISVEFLVSRLPRPLQALADCFVYFVGTVLYLVVFWRSVVEAIFVTQSGEVSPTLSIPFYPIILAIALGCLMLSFVLFTDFLLALKRVIRK